jgi:sigma-E factor negative regulatory protein RseA
MSENSREQISALMDGELGNESKSIIQALGKNDEHRRTWARYHLIRDCLHGNLPEHIDLDIAARVSEAIKSEPSIVAPSHTTNVLKPVLGFAIAASVAVIAILGIQQTNTTPSLSLPSQSIAIQQSIPAKQQLASNLIEQGYSQRVQQLPVATQIDAGSRLNRYLVNYNEYRANAGMRGMLPYVRIVSYETEEQE